MIKRIEVFNDLMKREISRTDIIMADKNLYKAKENGRNGTESS